MRLFLHGWHKGTRLLDLIFGHSVTYRLWGRYGSRKNVALSFDRALQRIYNIMIAELKYDFSLDLIHFSGLNDVLIQKKV